jgi:hypothetical protein
MMRYRFNGRTGENEARRRGFAIRLYGGMAKSITPKNLTNFAGANGTGDGISVNGYLPRISFQVNISKTRKPKSTSKTPGPKSGVGWRNSPLTKKEIDDICFFIDKGWDRQSISQFVGVSVSTVDKYKYARA